MPYVYMFEVKNNETIKTVNSSLYFSVFRHFDDDDFDNLNIGDVTDYFAIASVDEALIVKVGKYEISEELYDIIESRQGDSLYHICAKGDSMIIRTDLEDYVLINGVDWYGQYDIIDI